MLNTLGLVINPDKKEAFALAEKLEQEAFSLSRRVLSESPCPAGLKAECLPLKELVRQSDFLMVLGGDGSLLRVAREAAPLGKPLIGIHFGNYGFITEVDPEEAVQALRDVFKGRYNLSERLMLRTCLIRHNQVASEHFALNDVVISRGILSRLVRLRVKVGPKEVVRYSADGIIVATPTGSTAYSLSAGGPVIHPDVDVVVITPIAPHTLNSRALVIPAGDPIDVTAEKGAFEGVLTVDGQLMESLEDGDTIRISRAHFSARLIQTKDGAFYEQLESRLGFGDRYSR